MQRIFFKTEKFKVRFLKVNQFEQFMKRPCKLYIYLLTSNPLRVMLCGGCCMNNEGKIIR